MLSVAFILLLFVVASVPFAKERGFNSWLPSAICDCGCTIPAVTISVDSNNRVFIESSNQIRQVDVRAVRTIVARGLAESPGCPILVQANKQSDMGIVIRVFDQAKLARRHPPPAVSIAVVDS